MKQLLTISFCLGLAACATPEHMALHTADTSVHTGGDALLLMTLTVSHQNSTIRTPKVVVVEIDTPNPKKKADRHNFLPDGEGTVSTASGATTYDLRMALPPGRYRLVAAGGMVRVFPFTALFEAPFIEDFEVPSNSVLYLGHIDATLRPGKKGEFAAGPALPLLDQAAMGVSTGTFDITVSDQSATDLPMLRNTFPALRNTPVTVDLLPPFDRAKAQQWVNNNSL